MVNGEENGGNRSLLVRMEELGPFGTTATWLVVNLKNQNRIEAKMVKNNIFFGSIMNLCVLVVLFFVAILRNDKLGECILCVAFD